MREKWQFIENLIAELLLDRATDLHETWQVASLNGPDKKVSKEFL